MASALVLFSCFYWLTFFLLSRKIASKFICNYILSSIHAFMAILSWLHMTFISCDLPGKTFFTEYQCLDQTSAGMEICLLLSLSYFINDIINVRIIFVKGRMVLETYAHHTLGIVGIFSAI